MVRSSLSALVIWCAVARASAQGAAIEPTPEARAEASEHFRAGVELFRGASYGPALSELTRAYELVPDYRVLYNIAQAHLALADYVQASDVFAKYLEQGGILVEPRRRREVESELAGLAQRVAVLSVRSDAQTGEVVLDERTLGPSPLARDVKVSLGVHTLALRSEGNVVAQQTVDVAGGERRLVALAPAVTPVGEVVPPVAIPVSPGLGRRTRWGIGLLSSGVAAGLGAGAAYWLSRRAEDDYDAARNEGRSARGDRRRADRALLAAEISGATGAVLTASSVVLFLTVLTELTTPRRESTTAQHENARFLAVGVTRDAIMVTGHF